MFAKELYDVTIIGGGPAGLYSAFYAGLREMKTKIIESQPFLGGKVNLYPEKMIWDVGGLTPVTGEQLIRQLTQQAATFNPTIILNEKVTSIDQVDDCFHLHTESGQVHFSKTVILAIGAGILKPVKLELEGAEKFEETNLHYLVKSLAHFRDKTVLISGGGNSALDWAKELSEVAGRVYLAYRKDAFKGHEATISQVQRNGVICLLNTEIAALKAAADRPEIERVVLRHLDDQTVTELKIDELLVCHGFERDVDVILNSKVKIRMKDEYCIDGTPLSETSVPGIYAAGDILKHEGKLYLIAGAFQDAANAVNRAKQFISPEAAPYGMVSSHHEQLQEKSQQLKKQMVPNG